MPSPEESGRQQTAVLWVASGNDAYGQPKVTDPIEIQVRWEETNTEAVGPEGNPVTLSASVRVNQEIPVGSILYLGTLEAFEALQTANAITGLFEVVGRNVVPDIKGRKISRTLSLARYKDSLPTLVS